MTNKPNGTFFVATYLLLLSFLLTTLAQANARTEYLISMLNKGSSYRLRVQAATSLGTIRCKEAKDALVNALSDKHELVIIAAATALGEIGDPTVIPKMKALVKTAPTPAAKAQLETTIRILQALAPEGFDQTDKNIPSEKKQFLIRVDAMGNSSGQGGPEITELMKKIVIERLLKESDIVVQKTKLTPKKTKKLLKKEKLKGYYLSGSIISMKEIEGQLSVKISLNVFSNPDYNLLMMPSSEVTVPIPKGTIDHLAKESIYTKALEAVIDSLIKSVFYTLRNSNQQ